MNNLKKSKLPLFFCLYLLLILVITSSSVFASPTLDLTVTANKQAYYLKEIVYVFGNLTQDGAPVQDGLVGIQVDDSQRILVVRTQTTGVISQPSWLVEVLSVVPCNETGFPKDNFPPGKLAYFNVTIRNNDIEIRIALITVNVYDSSQTPIGASSFQGAISQQATVTLIISVPIPTTATIGTATVYANVYSGWPRIAGKPYSPEVSGTFQITSGASPPPTPAPPELQGNYNISFRLPSDGNTDTYLVSVSSIYQGQGVANSISFKVKVPGDVNGDNMVDGLDLTPVGMAWGSSLGQPDYDERCDFNADGTIDGVDLTLMGSNWG